MRGVPSGGEPSAPSAVEGPTVGAWEGRVWMEGDRQRRPSEIRGDESQKRITKVNGSNSLGFQWLPPPCKQVAPCRRWSLKFGGRGGAAATPRSIPAAERLSGLPGSGLRGAGAVSSPSAGWKLLSLVNHTCTRLWAETPLPGGGWCQQVFQQSSCCVCAEPAAAPRPRGGGRGPTSTPGVMPQPPASRV